MKLRTCPNCLLPHPENLFYNKKSGHCDPCKLRRYIDKYGDDPARGDAVDKAATTLARLVKRRIEREKLHRSKR